MYSLFNKLSIFVLSVQQYYSFSAPESTKSSHPVLTTHVFGFCRFYNTIAAPALR